MKKITLILVALTLLAAPAFAIDLDSVLANTKLSKSVAGNYFSDTLLNNYVLYTAHTKGSTVYGSGNLSTQIFVKGTQGENFESTDLPDNASSFDSLNFTIGTGKTDWKVN